MKILFFNILVKSRENLFKNASESFSIAHFWDPFVAIDGVLQWHWILINVFRFTNPFSIALVCEVHNYNEVNNPDF